MSAGTRVGHSVVSGTTSVGRVPRVRLRAFVRPAPPAGTDPGSAAFGSLSAAAGVSAASAATAATVFLVVLFTFSPAVRCCLRCPVLSPVHRALRRDTSTWLQPSAPRGCEGGPPAPPLRRRGRELRRPWTGGRHGGAVQVDTGLTTGATRQPCAVVDHVTFARLLAEPSSAGVVRDRWSCAGAVVEVRRSGSSSRRSEWAATRRTLRVPAAAMRPGLRGTHRRQEPGVRTDASTRGLR